MTNQTSKTALTIAIIALVLISSCSSPTGEVVAEPVTPIRWGFITPLTGTATLYGVPALNAAQMAVDEINAKGGLSLPGESIKRKLELIVEDGKCDGPASVTAAKKLIEVDKVQIIHGGHCSTESMAILPVTQEAGVFQLAGTTSTPSYTGKGKYALRVMPSATYTSGIEAEVAFEKGIRSVAVFYELRDFPQGVVDAFSKRFIELGGKIIAKESFAPAETDFRTTLSKVKDASPDAVLVSAQGPDSASLIFKQLKEVGIDVPVMGDPVTISTGTWKKSEGAMPPTAWGVIPHTGGHENEIAKNFLNGYTARFGEFGIDLSAVAQNYDGIKLMAEAVEKCGESDKDCIRSYFLSIKDRPSAVGSISFQSDGDPIFGVALTRIVEGKTVVESIPATSTK